VVGLWANTKVKEVFDRRSEFQVTFFLSLLSSLSSLSFSKQRLVLFFSLFSLYFFFFFLFFPLCLSLSLSLSPPPPFLSLSWWTHAHISSRKQKSLCQRTSSPLTKIFSCLAPELSAVVRFFSSFLYSYMSTIQKKLLLK